MHSQQVMNMSEQVLFRNRRDNRPATFEEYRESGGYQALALAVQRLSPKEVRDKRWAPIPASR